MTCDCPDKIILVKGDAEYVASESWCKIHGYETSCYACCFDNLTTEMCARHGQWLPTAKGEWFHTDAEWLFIPEWEGK